MDASAPVPPAGPRIRLILLAEHALFRVSLSRLLAMESDIEVFGESGTGSDALGLLKERGADIVLLELGADDTFLSSASDAGYQGRFLIMAGSTDARRAAMAIRNGASGVVLKSDSIDRLLQAIRMVAAGDMWVDQRVIRLLADRYPFGDERKGQGLTNREERVMAGIVGGLSNRKIAGDMGTSEGAVKAIVQQLFIKTGVRKRSQLVRIAMERSAHAA